MTENMAKGITKRSDGRYMGRFEYLGEKYVVYGKTAKEAKTKLEDLRYEVKHDKYCRPEHTKVDVWFTKWMETYKKNTIKPLTFKRYSDTYRLYISKELGQKNLCDVNPQMIQKLINDIYNNKGSESQVKISYVILKGMFTQAVKNQMIVYNPMEAVSLPKLKKIRADSRRVMTLDEQQIFLKYAQDSSYYPFYIIALQTGMRINEVCALQWSDIDFKKKEIHVTGTLIYIRGQGKYKGSPKSETSNRVIPMLPDVEEILKGCKVRQNKNRILLGKEYKEEPEIPNLVLTYPEGGALWDTAIRCDIKKIVKRINADGIEFEPITPHTFRHTFATRCAESGMPLQVLKTILGHSSLAMTSDLYSHVLPDTKKEEMKKIVNLF